MLHPDEPPLPDPGMEPVHVLRYVPRALLVEPDGPPLGWVFPRSELGVNEIAVLPRGVQFTPRESYSLALHRWGFPVEAAYAVTDYFTQGQSFPLEQQWLADMRQPTKGPWLRASLYVMLTRFRSMDALRLLCPLWPEGNVAAEAKVKGALRHILVPDPDLAAEWRRFQQLAQVTAQQYDTLLSVLKQEAEAHRR